MNYLQMSQSRYILPSFIERTSYGVKESPPTTSCSRAHHLPRVQIDDASANDVMAQLLVLESTTQTATSRCTSTRPADRFTSLMAIYDTMQYIRPTFRRSASGRRPRRGCAARRRTPGRRFAWRMRGC